METMPVFIKAGGIVPMQKHQPNSRQLGNAVDMDVYVAPGSDGSFRLYEDNGTDLAYQSGGYCMTAMQLAWEKTNATFEIFPAEGDVSLIPERRNWRIFFRGFCKGCCFAVQGESVNTFYDEQTNTYVVSIADIPVSKGIMVTVTHQDGLIHDNSDCRKRMIDCLTRGQTPLYEKEKLLAVFDANYEKAKHGHKILKHECGSDQTVFGSKIFELLQQIG
jgi:hypothetical protein